MSKTGSKSARLCASAAIIQLLISAPANAQPQDEENHGFISTANRCPTNGAPANQRDVDGYTRLEFSTDETVPIGIDYGRELRNPISRFFAGKSVTRTLTLNATYSRHNVEATSTVVSFSHKSSRRGYEWTSEVSNQRLVTPYFRIDHDSVVRTSWKLALNKTYDVRAVQDLLDVVKRATKLISPTSGLLTSLNADRFQDTSQFVDRSVSSFLRESVDEIAPDEFPLASCVGEKLVSITVELPEGANVVRHMGQPQKLGTWTLRLAKAIRSIFLPNEANQLSPAGVVARIGAGTVFDFQVAEDLSLGQFLGGDNAVSSVKEEFVTNTNDAITASKLCAVLVGKLQGIGLNRFDAAVGVLAFADQMIPNSDHRNLLRDNCAILAEPT